jgi:hypothetical protein
MVWLASDAAARFNGQCFTFNGRKTALWTQPREVHEAFHARPWSVDELSAHYADIAPEPLYQARFVE